MSARRIFARPPRSQRPRRRHRGRLAPLNGSVTRADIEAIFAEFMALPVDPPPTAEEFKRHLIGAITDWSPSPRQRAAIAQAARIREAGKKAKRQAPKQLAQSPSRALAAA